MDRLKELFLDTGSAEQVVVKDKVEVVGMSILTCLRKAGEVLNTDLASLDYEVLQKGKQSFLKPLPYRLLVSILAKDEKYADLEEFSLKLGVGSRLLSDELDHYVTPKNKDGRVLVRVYRTGVYLTVFPALGDGRQVDKNTALMRIQHTGITQFDPSRVEDIVKEARGEPVKISAYTPRPDADSTVKVDISPDEMTATIRITPPKPGGRHLEVQDVINALKAHGVVIGFLEEDIRQALLEDRYMQDIVGAKGVPPQHGDDARIDYKVQIKKEGVHLEEDAKGRVDYKNMNLIENVVVGQILAEKLPAKKGKMGRTLHNRLVEARDGREVELKQGRGTILSEDKNKLIAEINGQVVYSHMRISVEPVFRVSGDVGPKTGNIMFLGSVHIGGNVLDNYEVKAAGNVEITGAVQKAKIEAEGDIVVKAGILGREGARVESTGGSLMAKFIQSAEVHVANDVVAQEGILHSKVEAGGRIICNGRRAQIVGGNIRATKEVRARLIGSQAYTATEVIVGTDPRLLAQAEEIGKLLKENEDNLKKAEKTTATLKARREADPDSFTPEQAETMEKNHVLVDKLQVRARELTEEKTKMDETMARMGAEGKVHAEKELFPGVVITIKDASQTISDTYRSVTLSYDNGYVKIGKFEKGEDAAQTTSRSWRRR